MEKCKNISHPEWEMTFRVARLAEEIHLGEVRRVSGMPYITHPIEIVLEYINQKRYPNWKSIIVLLLHDTLESHPERWQEILDIVPLDIFFRILKLSQLSEEIRGEIKDFLFDKLIAAPEDDIPILTTLILDMLTHNPERKKEILDRMNPYVK